MAPPINQDAKQTILIYAQFLTDHDFANSLLPELCNEDKKMTYDVAIELFGIAFMVIMVTSYALEHISPNL